MNGKAIEAFGVKKFQQGFKFNVTCKSYSRMWHRKEVFGTYFLKQTLNNWCLFYVCVYVLLNTLVAIIRLMWKFECVEFKLGTFFSHVWAKLSAESHRKNWMMKFRFENWNYSISNSKRHVIFNNVDFSREIEQQEAKCNNSLLEHLLWSYDEESFLFFSPFFCVST